MQEMSRSGLLITPNGALDVVTYSVNASAFAVGFVSSFMN